MVSMVIWGLTAIGGARRRMEKGIGIGGSITWIQQSFDKAITRTGACPSDVCEIHCRRCGELRLRQEPKAVRLIGFCVRSFTLQECPA